jgi:GR25 family glycosyltransferase involved in LPS biosynthesis
MNVKAIVKKSRAVLRKGPSVARNILYSQFDYWPARRLQNDAIRNLPIYCISMSNATRRRQVMESQVRGMELSAFTFVEAVSSDNLDHAALQREGLYDDAKANRYHERSLTEIACSLSHGQIYDLVVSRGHEVAMIVEDDSLFIPSRLDKIVLEDLPAGWDIAFLNSFIENGRPRRRIAGSLYDGDAYTGSSGAYLVSQGGAQKLADGYKPVIHATDGYTGRNDISRFMYYPDCVLNGSVCHYFDNTVEFIPARAGKS